jgi:hypothetical protein
MNKTEYVYLIDPFKKDITLVHLPTGKLELETIYNLVQCATIDMYSLTHDTDLIIDDEGLYVEDQKFFVIEDKVFAGRALIVGAANEDGHSTTPTYPMDFLPVVYTSEHPEVGVAEFKVTSWETGESPVDVQLYIDEPIRRSDDTTYEEA